MIKFSITFVQLFCLSCFVFSCFFPNLLQVNYVVALASYSPTLSYTEYEGGRSDGSKGRKLSCFNMASWAKWLIIGALALEKR